MDRQDPVSRDAERIVRYELDAMVGELSALERKAEILPPRAAQNLQGCPHVVKLLETRAGGLAARALQQLLARTMKLVRLVRPARHGVAAPLPAPTAIAPTAIAAAGQAAPSGMAAAAADTPRLLLDITFAYRHPDIRGGIPRVVREISRAAAETGLALPVHQKGEKFFSCLAGQEGREVTIRPGDTYLVIDVYWAFLEDSLAAIDRARAAGGRIGVVSYDIFPILHPAFFHEELTRSFRDGFLKVMARCDACAAISADTEAAVRDYLGRIDFPGRERIRFGHFPLGVSARPPANQAVRPEVAALFEGGRSFLSVGTMEPRKGYAITLDACDIAWKAGHDFRMVILGHPGWRSQALQDRIRQHLEHGTRLVWMKDANDAELALAYRECRSLIQSSVAEGFGLPVIEAAAAGAPVIASDLGVFREIGGEGILYYPVAQPEALAARMAEALASRPAPARTAIPDWHDAMRGLAACLGHGAP